ncbi:UNVERIFIED_CONTAM: hypothetical protein Sindi_1106600 [Sesamum indicum]
MGRLTDGESTENVAVIVDLAHRLRRVERYVARPSTRRKTTGFLERSDRRNLGENHAISATSAGATCMAVTDSTRRIQWWCACDATRRSNFPATGRRRRGGDAAVEEELGCLLVVVVRLKEGWFGGGW